MWQGGGWRAGVGKTVVGGPSKVLDCGAGWARLQMVGKEQLADTKRQWLVEKVVTDLLTDKPGGTKGPTQTMITQSSSMGK